MKISIFLVLLQCTLVAPYQALPLILTSKNAVHSSSCHSQRQSLCTFEMSADVRSIRFFSRRDAINVLALSGITLFPFSKPASARKSDGDGLFEKISAQTGALDSVEALINEEKWKDARKKAKDIDVALRSGVIMPLSRSVGRKVKGIVEMQTILFEDFVELEKNLRSQNAIGAKAQVDRVRSTVRQLLGMEESILEVL